jgi:hypothetical protein
MLPGDRPGGPTRGIGSLVAIPPVLVDTTDRPLTTIPVLHACGRPCRQHGSSRSAQGHMELSPSPIAEAFGLGTPTGPLVAITSGPSAVHRSWRLSTSRGRFAVKAFNRDPHARGVEALEGPVRLELAALAAGVPLPRPCLAVATGAGVAEVAGLGPQPVLVCVHDWVDRRTPRRRRRPGWPAGSAASWPPSTASASLVARAHRSHGGIGPSTVRPTGGGWPRVRSGLGVGGRGACGPRCRCWPRSRRWWRPGRPRPCRWW